VVREHEHQPTAEVTTRDVARVQVLSEKLTVYNAEATVQCYRASGDAATPAPSPTLRDVLIHSVKSAPNTFQFNVPLNREALAAFNRAAGQTLAFEHRVEIAKSEGKDWNQDLMQEQLRQVVKRGLDGTGKTARRRSHAG